MHSEDVVEGLFFSRSKLRGGTEKLESSKTAVCRAYSRG